MTRARRPREHVWDDDYESNLDELEEPASFDAMPEELARAVLGLRLPPAA